MAKFSVRDIDLVGQLERAKKDFTAIKASQLYGGTQMVIKKSYSPIVASVDDIFGGLYYGDIIYKRITFTAKNQKNPIGKLLIDLRSGTSTTPDTAGVADVLYYVILLPIPETGKLVWEVDIRGSTNFWAVFEVLASDEGFVTVEDVTF